MAMVFILTRQAALKPAAVMVSHEMVVNHLPADAEWVNGWKHGESTEFTDGQTVGIWRESGTGAFWLMFACHVFGGEAWGHWWEIQDRSQQPVSQEPTLQPATNEATPVRGACAVCGNVVNWRGYCPDVDCEGSEK